MSRKKKQVTSRVIHAQYTSSDIARLENGSVLSGNMRLESGMVSKHLTMKETSKNFMADKRRLTAKVAVCVMVLVVIGYLSLGIMGAMGQYYPYTEAYQFYSPVEVGRALYEHAYNALASLTHLWAPHSNTWLLENVPCYWAVATRAGVVGITLLCGILLTVSGMLYQNVFHNPLAGPGMLGASSGVTLGMVLLVALYSSQATAMLVQRYTFCYGFGVAILLFVILVGRKVSGKGKPYDIITMLLVGSILGQLIGFLQMYIVFFVMDESDQLVFQTLSQMLVVDTSWLSWACLVVAFCVSFIPVYVMRYRMNGLAFDDDDVKLLGINQTRLRGVALIAGAIMMLAAQIHTGSVGMVSMIVPFLSRNWFGCEFSKQLTGNICLGTVLLLVCRDIADSVPFVGDGIGIGVIVQIVAMPIFAVIMAKFLKGWD